MSVLFLLQARGPQQLPAVEHISLNSNSQPTRSSNVYLFIGPNSGPGLVIAELNLTTFGSRCRARFHKLPTSLREAKTYMLDPSAPDS